MSRLEGILIMLTSLAVLNFVQSKYISLLIVFSSIVNDFAHQNTLLQANFNQFIILFTFS